MKEKPTVFVREILFLLWCRQQALIHLLEEKQVFGPKDYAREIERKLKELMNHLSSS